MTITAPLRLEQALPPLRPHLRFYEINSIIIIMFVV